MTDLELDPSSSAHLRRVPPSSAPSPLRRRREPSFSTLASSFRSFLILFLLIYWQSFCEFVIYVSGEESVEQIGTRANRLSIRTGELFLHSSTDIEVSSRILGRIPESRKMERFQLVEEHWVL